MAEALDRLMLQFLGWVAQRPRTYADAMDAWRSTCPRLTVWEDALGDGLIEICSRGEARRAEVSPTARGRAMLDRAGRGDDSA